MAAGVHELREVVSGRGGSQVQENENAPVHAALELSIQKRALGARVL